MQQGSKARTSSWILDSVLLFAVTAALIWPLFTYDFVDNWASIESTFIADGRYLRENLPHPGWQPNWYCGTRFDYVYPPALRYGTALISKALSVSTARSYHIYTCLMYCLGIVGVYLLARVGSRRRYWALLCGLASTIVSPSFLFLPQFYQDYQAERLMPVRWGVLIRYGEGPHISAFSMLGFCLAAAWLGVRGGRRGMLLLAGLFAALTVSNNFYGATALALFFPVLVWVAYVEKQSWVVLLRGVAVAVLAWGLTAWWLTPTYLTVTLRNMRLVSTPGNWWSRLLFVVVLAAAGWLIWRFGRGRPERSWLLFAAVSLGVYAFVVLGNSYFAVRILGESLRLVPEFDLCFILAAAVLGAWLWARGRVYQVAVVALLVLAVMPSKGWVRRSWQHIRGPVDYTQRVEYQVSKWVHDNLPGQRVLAIGSFRFWYNAWFDLPQTGGGSEQGSLNLFPNTAYFAVTYGIPNEDSLAYLRATGTDAFTVSDEKSVEVYHDFAKPHVFEGFFPVLYDDQKGNRIYRVPRKFPGIVRVVEKDQVLKIPRDERGDPKMEVVRAYAAALEEGPDTQPEFTRVSPSEMRIRVKLEKGQALEVLETFDSGWHARTAAGTKVAIERDPFDFMMVDAGPGEHEVTLEFLTPFENRLGRMVTVVTLLLYLGFVVGIVGRR